MIKLTVLLNFEIIFLPQLADHMSISILNYN